MERRAGRVAVPTHVPLHLKVNRRLWERHSASYDRQFAAILGGRSAMAWGFWRIPESRLRLLGPVRRRRILELGCGAARWSIALAKAGARPLGLDLSTAQLRIARRLVRSAAVDVPLVEASAESIPLRDRSMDIVFCDWGAMTFADPARTVPECARVLRSGGRLVFSTLSPISALFRDVRRDRIMARLVREYFGLRRLDFRDEVNFVRPYGDWIRLFTENGFVVEALVETQPRAGVRTPYLTKRESNWGRRWPMETIWRVRKSPKESRRPNASIHP